VIAQSATVLYATVFTMKNRFAWFMYISLTFFELYSPSALWGQELVSAPSLPAIGYYHTRPFPYANVVWSKTGLLCRPVENEKEGRIRLERDQLLVGNEEFAN
jgi:hypothetical protein